MTSLGRPVPDIPVAAESAGSWSNRTRRLILLDGVCSRLMDTLTGGAFLAGLALFLGASNAMIGLLASLPFLAQVFQWPAVSLLVRVADRRRIVVWAAGAARAIFLVIAFLLALGVGWLNGWTLLGILSLATVLTVFASAAWNWWMRDVVPRSMLGRFFGNRLRLTTLVSAAALLGAGGLVDAYIRRGSPGAGFAWLFAAGGFFGFLGVYCLSRTPHPAHAMSRPSRGQLSSILAVVGAPHHRALLVSLILVASTVAVALPYTAVYLLRSVQYSFLLVTLLVLVSQLAYVSSLRGWGYLSDRFGNRPVLQISVGLLVAALLGWASVWTEPGWPLLAFLVALHFLTGFAVAGIELSSANVLLKTAPDDNAPAFLAGMAMARALIAGLATIAAGLLWEGLGVGPVVELGRLGGIEWSIRGFHVLALVSVALGLVAVPILTRVREEGGAPTLDVARAMRREVQMMSSVAGIRAFVHAVSYIVEFVAVRGTPRSRRARSPGRSDAPQPRRAAAGASSDSEVDTLK